MTIKLIDVWPGSVKKQNLDGSLPIQIACACKAPALVTERLLDAWRDCVKERDHNGRLPVHIACEYKAPAAATLKLIEVWPQSIAEMDEGWQGKQETVEGQGMQGQRRGSTYKEVHKNREQRKLPIQIACLNQAPEETIIKLVELWPESVKKVDIDGSLPIHLATYQQAPAAASLKLIEVWQESVKERTKKGKLPIHFACEYGAPSEVTIKLIEVWPECVEKDRDGDLLIILALKTKAPAEVLCSMVKADLQTGLNGGVWNAIVELPDKEEVAAQILRDFSDNEVKQLADSCEPAGGKRKAILMATENNRKAMEDRLLFLSLYRIEGTNVHESEVHVRARVPARTHACVHLCRRVECSSLKTSQAIAELH